jgi:hypothetical protein
MVVEVGNAVHGINDKEDYIGLLDRECYLLVDFAFKYVFGVYYPTSGVYDGKFVSRPFDFAILAVASCAGSAVNDSGAGFC